MFPVIALLGLAGVGLLVMRNRKPAMSDADRATLMERLADIMFRIINRGKSNVPPYVGSEPQEAVNAALLLGMPKTAEGIRSGKGLPNDEEWPGTSMSVAAFMDTYSKRRLAAPPAPPGPKVYKDETPIPPFDDPRAIRAKAIALEKSGKSAEARIYHAKADVLNKLIRTAKTKNAAVSTAKGLGKALSSLTSFNK